MTANDYRILQQTCERQAALSAPDSRKAPLDMADEYRRRAEHLERKASGVPIVDRSETPYITSSSAEALP
jgi:hypothetical protein